MTAPVSKEEREYRLLRSLSHLPRKILSLHGTENIPEFVLYELSQDDCLNLNKAAYFVDNPDFDCLKGVAGLARSDLRNWRNVWEQAEDFSQHMSKSPFNTKVRGIYRTSIKRNGLSENEYIQEVGKALELDHPHFYSWHMKHNNHGLLIFEQESELDVPSDIFMNGLYLLGFCPIY